MIKKPSELDFSNKKIRMIIAGLPGTGKTTLAESAPKPLLIDLDNGIDRVEARHRGDIDVVVSMEELMADLVPKNLVDYETVVIDTGGKLLELMKVQAIKTSPKNARSDGALSLQGYGAIKKLFSEFITYVETLDKHIIYVFHATEVHLDNDLTGLRIRAEGSAKDFIWDNIDFGGFIEMRGKTREINFSPCERYYAKGTHNLKGKFQIPSLDNGEKNLLLTNLFDKVRDDLNIEVTEKAKYDEIMEIAVDVKACEDIDTLNKLFKQVTTLKHILTTKEELWDMINKQADKLGAKYDKEQKVFSLCDAVATK